MPPLKSKFEQCADSMKSIIQRSVQAILGAINIVEKLFTCLSRDPSGTQAAYQRDCLSLLLPSLFGPEGIITNFAARIENVVAPFEEHYR